MVTRKPVPTGADAGLAPASSPPYPITPTASNAPPPFRMQDVRNELRSPQSESDSTSAWSGEGLDKIVGQDTGSKQGIPDSLKVGPPGYTPKGSQEMLRPSAATTNPYLQKQNTRGGELGDGRESSVSAWGGFAERPAPPTEAPPPPLSKGRDSSWIREQGHMLTYPDAPPPSEQFTNLSVSESSNNPWQPALSAASSEKPSPLPSLHRQDSGNEAWAAPPPARQAPSIPEQQPVLIDVDETESPAWDEDDDPESPVAQEMPATPLESKQIAEEQHAWDESQGQSQYQQPAESRFLIPEQGEGWNIVDHEGPGQHSGIISADGAVLERFTSEEHAPALPPRRSQEQLPPQPPRPTVDTTNRSTSSIASPAAIAARKQKKETYEIKKITWYDVTAAQNLRVSPILVQNANGPCPLLALVNALTLSTPANTETALVETLRSREQVSLGLLLDAVFDELMSGRRGDAAQELPDVSDLYQFLLALHTGMNVNPRFFPLAQSKSAADPRNSMSHIHPTEREAATPGTFEDTREMKLYSTFSIPLIHGWLPDRGSPAYSALKRSANSYEDAQNLMFHEEGLEDKLQREGLSFEEQATLEDIATIKAFFNTAATQLTPFGLDTITTSLAPGAVAILFRNDHFSTLYRHPDTLQLLQLVTDMGYAGHEEVVWESLIDVNGENAEFFSGDFRLVGGAPASPVLAHAQPPSNDGWTTVPIRNQPQHPQDANSLSTHIPQEAQPRSPTTEQEDHDLALALQLQEEEEERHRAEVARRQRETELSQQYIEQQGQQVQQNSNVPVSQRGGLGGRNRGPSNSNQGRGGASLEARPAIPPRRSGPGAGGQPIDPEAGVDAPPPSYEQAANQAAYVPPANHPAHPNSSPITQRRMSAYSATASIMGNSPAGNGRGRRQTLVEQIPGGRPVGRVNTGGSMRGQGLAQQQQDERSKDCIVM